MKEGLEEILGVLVIVVGVPILCAMALSPILLMILFTYLESR